jgi:hypothetical protein
MGAVAKASIKNKTAVRSAPWEARRASDAAAATAISAKTGPRLEATTKIASNASVRHQKAA